MALPEEPLSIVEQWKKKSSEMSSASNDSIVSLLSRSIETISVALNKKADNDRIQRALSFLEYERSLSLQFDKIKNDEIRSLVYGQIECLQFALHELTKDRNQVKECGEMFTQTDQGSSQPSLVHPLHLNDSSHNDCDYTHEEPPVNWLEVPKEELFDENIWGDEMAIKDEDFPYEDVGTHKDGDLAGDSVDVACIVDYVRAQSEVSALNNTGADFVNEDVDDTMNDSMANEIMGEDKERAHSAVPALNFVRDEPNFENENNDETMNEKDNIEEDGAKDLSETVEVGKKRRSSRNVSRTALVDDFSDFSDDDYEPTMKKPKANSTKMKIRKTSDTVEKKFQTTSVKMFVGHLKKKHSTTIALAGLALLCDCGVEVQSNNHKYKDKCNIANFTVIRKRDGPIKRLDDEKTTPQCILCEVYPSTARGYESHLHKHHKSSLSANGIYLMCSCGAKYRHSRPDPEHTNECNRLEYTLHKLADK